MERLTMRNVDGIAFWADEKCPGGGYRMDDNPKDQERLDHLSAYEDTGLAPEEIMELCNMDKRAKMADLLRLEEYQALGPIDHLRELAQAEKDGRLVVLPVPVGKNKMAYALPDSFSRNQEIFTIECERLDGLEIWENPGNEVVVVVDGCEIGESDIGKTVFLTREEAEAALKKREDC